MFVGRASTENVIRVVMALDAWLDGQDDKVANPVETQFVLALIRSRGKPLAVARIGGPAAALYLTRQDWRTEQWPSGNNVTYLGAAGFVNDWMHALAYLSGPEGRLFRTRNAPALEQMATKFLEAHGHRDLDNDLGFLFLDVSASKPLSMRVWPIVTRTDDIFEWAPAAYPFDYLMRSEPFSTPVMYAEAWTQSTRAWDSLYPERAFPNLDRLPIEKRRAVYDAIVEAARREFDNDESRRKHGNVIERFEKRIEQALTETRPPIEEIQTLRAADPAQYVHVDKIEE